MAFDSNQYSWVDLTVFMLGKPVAGITALKYDTERPSENLYGAGAEPHSYTKGQKNYTGSMTLLQSELETLQRSLPKGKDLTDIAAFQIVAAYASDTEPIVTDRLKGCRITKVPKDIGSKKPTMEVELTLSILKIEYNVA